MSKEMFKTLKGILQEDNPGEVNSQIDFEFETTKISACLEGIRVGKKAIEESENFQALCAAYNDVWPYLTRLSCAADRIRLSVNDLRRERQAEILE